MTDESDLPALPDYPSLCQLARALWRVGSTGGAAVMVGAGFSRNALVSGEDVPKPPTWHDLASRMRNRLYPSRPGDAPADLLRLAEEFRTYLGQAALDELIRTSIVDEGWQPGPMHRDLLELPWSDVLTTNWDTLLERGAREVTSRAYETVRSQADLPHARAPRIIKLHGSVGADDSFTVAEEDFRRYPTERAAFVNTARQVFLENELCLVGFSGDDPNYGQWSGWVRDHLAGSARRVYLVGDLHLSAPKRKFLEARNIAPVDLADLPSVRKLDPEDRPAASIRAFLHHLEAARPRAAHDWPCPGAVGGARAFKGPDGRKDPEEVWAVLKCAADGWRLDRENYPGWLICPASVRRNIHYGFRGAFWPTDALLTSLGEPEHHPVLYELAWRLVISFRPFDERLAAALASAADPAPSADLPPRQRIEIACWLLDHHRKDGNRAAFDRWASVVEAHSREGSDRRAAVTYQRLLRLRDDLDFRALSAGLGEPPGEDPAWGLRWAALHCDCGQTGDAERIVARTLAELRTRQSADRYSVWIRSRRAWAEWLSRAHIMTRPGRVPDEWPTEFREPRCDPWTEIEGLERAVAEGLRNRRDGAEHVEPGYDAGTYTDRRNTIHLTSSSEIGAAGVLGSIMEAAGIPVRIGPVDLVGQLAQDAEELAFIPGASWHLCRLRTAKDLSTASLDSRFGRVSIASLEAENVVALWSATWRAASYWHERMVRPNAAGVDLDYAGEQLRLHVELLSRLVARRSREDALACLALARDLGRDVRSLPWMAHEQIGHLLNRAGAAVGPFADPDAMLLALEFPLSSEAGAQADRWPNPTGTSAGWLLAAGSTRPMGDSRWTSRVGMLLDAVRASGPERAEAAVRLTHLADADALTGQETASFRDAVWSRLETGVPAWPAGLTLFPHVVARLPAPVTFNPSAAARSLLFDTPLPPDGLERLEAIAAAACEDGRHAPMLPDAAQAARLFDQVVSMPADPAEPGTPAAAFRGPLRRSCEEAAARVLARSVVPSLRPEDVTADRLTSLNAAAGRLPAGDFLEALPRFTLIGPEVTTDLLSRLRRAAVEGKPGAAFAIVAWARLARSGLAAPVPLDLLAQAVSAVETVRGISLNAFLWCARRLVEAGMLPPPMTDRLTEVLGASLDTKGYHPTILGGGDAVAVPLVRAECVRLAAALKESGQTGTFIESWLALAAVDPLPEVRHALSTATFI